MADSAMTTQLLFGRLLVAISAFGLVHLIAPQLDVVVKGYVSLLPVLCVLLLIRDLAQTGSKPAWSDQIWFSYALGLSWVLLLWVALGAALDPLF